jgi:NTE family protein
MSTKRPVAKTSVKPPAKKAAKPTAQKKTFAELAARYQRVALMLQGGGALGSYQVGVYKALAEAKCHPSWVCGVSIGAINGAIIAGNAPDQRVARLEEFWTTITARNAAPFSPLTLPTALLGPWATAASTWMTVMMGQPGFFSPRKPNLWQQGDAASATSFYDTSQLRTTLERLVDFDRLNSGETRLSVGAVNIETGNNIFFDTTKQRLGPEHIMASGALPPALPMVKIDNAYYWDGGIVSNTPLQYMLDQDEDVSALVFQVDLFSAKGDIPQKMAQVAARQKDIVYSSRTREATTAFKRILSLRRQLADALHRLPANRLRAGESDLMRDYADAGVVNLIQLIYQSKPFENDTKDYEFSASSMRAHSQAGYLDTTASMARTEWFDLPSAEDGVVDHDVHRGAPKSRLNEKK